MQISSTPSILPGGCYDTHPTNTGPIGVSYFGKLRIGHAMNGISYTDHALLGPLSAPVLSFTGSLDDAIEGAQQYLARTEIDDAGRGVLALTGIGTSWTAHIVNSDPTLVQAIDHGAGTGGIASIEWTQASKSLGALVTAVGVLTPHARIAE